MLKNNRILGLLLALLVLFAGCGDDKKNGGKKPVTTNGGEEIPKPVMRTAPQFNADTAFAFIEKQLSFGPRIPNSSGHVKCGDWIVAKFKSYGAEVTEQKVNLTAHDGAVFRSRNIIASYNPEAATRVIVSCHWDSRPFADKDPEKPNAPVPAANDGGSGVGMILEFARLIKDKTPTVGIDFIMFDAEDYGAYDVENSFSLGSQYWSKNKHKPGYHAKFGINLDMVGAKGARFIQEGWSRKFAPGYTNQVWIIAQELGYGNYFPNVGEDYGVTDDHYYVATIANIPMVEIIDRDMITMEFFPHWHRTTDDISKISRETLKAVGQTVLETLFRER